MDLIYVTKKARFYSRFYTSVTVAFHDLLSCVDQTLYYKKFTYTIKN